MQITNAPRHHLTKLYLSHIVYFTYYYSSRAVSLQIDALPEANPPCICIQTSSEDSNRYGRANTNYPVIDTYTEGSILEVKIVVSTSHMVSRIYHV